MNVRPFSMREAVNPALNIVDGVKTVTTAGTRVQVTATITPILWITVQALSTNTGTIFVGGSTIDSTRGVHLTAGEAYDIRVRDLSAVWLDSSVNGEKLTYLYGTIN